MRSKKETWGCFLEQMMTMAYELKRRGGGIGACAICGGLTQGDACVIMVD